MTLVLERAAPTAVRSVPFDAAKLDDLLEAAGIDVLIVSSKHNVQYLLGGYTFFFFDYKEAIGLSRYLPVIVYVRGDLGKAAYIAARLEIFEEELGRFWMPNVFPVSWGTTDAMAKAIAYLRSLARPGLRIGMEAAFMPLDAGRMIEEEFAGRVADATVPLERLRAVKTAKELDLLRLGSEKVVDSMRAVFAAAEPGMTKNDLVRRLQLAEVEQGLIFEYCLVTAGSDLNRAPSDVVLREGDIFSLDSGGNYRGWVGDLCRMGILGQPDGELEDLLGAVEAIQQAARRPIRAGARGGDIFASAEAVMAATRHEGRIDFLAHGMGLVSHEAPRLTGEGPVPYPGDDADLPLEAGMVISIETAILHPRRGFVKLEDTVAVTKDGCTGFGDGARGWNHPA